MPFLTFQLIRLNLRQSYSNGQFNDFKKTVGCITMFYEKLSRIIFIQSYQCDAIFLSRATNSLLVTALK